MNFIRNLMEEVSHDLHIHSQPRKIKCGAPLEMRNKMEKILRGFNDASFYPLLSEEEKEAFKKIIEVLSKTELSVIQINKVLYSVDTELYKIAMNKSLNNLQSTE